MLCNPQKVEGWRAAFFQDWLACILACSFLPCAIQLLGMGIQCQLKLCFGSWRQEGPSPGMAEVWAGRRRSLETSWSTTPLPTLQANLQTVRETGWSSGYRMAVSVWLSSLTITRLAGSCGCLLPLSIKRQYRGNALVVQWLALGAFTVVAQVQSLVGELRSHKPCGAQ